MKDLYLSRDFIIIGEQEREYYVIRKFPFQKFQINEDSYKILEYIQEHDGLPARGEPVAEHILSFLQQLLEIGILTESSARKSSASIKKITQTPACQRIFLEMTPHCNLKCQHCYNAYDTRKIAPEKTLTTAEVFALIDQAHSIGVWQFELTGGELFLRADIWEILDYLDQKGMLVTLFSNLTLLDEAKARRLRELNIFKVNTSLDGFSDEVHDNFRGIKGSRQKTIASIRLLQEQGIDVNVNVIVGDHNFTEIDALIDYLRLDLHVTYMADVILPLGRGSEVKTFENYAPYLGYLNYLKGQKEPCTVHSMGEFTLPTQTFCGVGENFLYIGHDGGVQLCTSLTHHVSEEFSFGNVRNVELAEIWANRMTQFRNLACNQQSSCPAKDKCQGGCRSRAYAVYGSLDHPDEVYCKIYGVHNG